jgi:uncharacterized DUF497 family protein
MRSPATFSRPVVVLPAKENPQGEQRFCGIGASGDGRKVFVVFTLHKHRDGVRIRPISARYMHKKRWKAMKRAIPTFKTDKEAEDFVATADLAKYDLSGAR